jgi:hypothetical protein
MVDKMRYDIILRVYPSFGELIQTLSELRDKIVQSRGNRENRETIYAIIETTDLPGLVKKYRNLMASEQIMRRMAIVRRWERVGNYVVGLAGVILAAIGVYLAAR